MSAQRFAHEAFKAVVRPASAVAFAAVCSSIVACTETSSAASVRRMTGWQAWMSLGDYAGWIAMACLVVQIAMRLIRDGWPDEPMSGPRWCPWFNLATIALVLFVPKIAAL